MATRKTFVDANSQHLPDDAWFVIGEPSSAILILNFWVSDMAADRDERTAFAALELSAARARRFCHGQLLNSEGKPRGLPLGLPSAPSPILRQLPPIHLADAL
jgi:hypothetical protein